MLITTAQAKTHLRLSASYPDDQVLTSLNAAILSAQEFMSRNIYENDTALRAAVAVVPAALETARQNLDDAVSAAREITDCEARDTMIDAARRTYREALAKGRATCAGIVMDDMIKAGIFLLLGHFFENREDVVVGVGAVELPFNSQAVLMPYRIEMGV